MDNTRKMLVGGLAVATIFTLSACNPKTENVDPEILKQLNTPCKGEVSSTFKDSDYGWVLTVSCLDKAKIKAQRDERRNSAGGDVESGVDTEKLFSFE